MNAGRELIQLLYGGAVLPRPPFIPILGRFAQTLSQANDREFAHDAQEHVRSLLQAADAVRVDAVTVGLGCPVDVGVEACRRLTPSLQGRALAAILADPNPAAARAYCEAGADMVIIIRADQTQASACRTLSNVCRFYKVAVILARADSGDAHALARQLGLSGGIVPHPDGREEGIVGGGLGDSSDDAEAAPPPRAERFFWSFPGEVAPDSNPERLVKLGEALTA